MYVLGRGGLSGLVAALVSALVIAAPAAAHPQEEADDPAKVIVQQAIALIVNTPGDVAAIEEHLHLAQESPDQEGVDADLLEQAIAALGEGDLAETRQLLLECIGARPVTGHKPPEPIRETSEMPAHGQPAEEAEPSGDTDPPRFAVGSEAGTTVVLDAYEPSTQFDGGRIALLVVSIVAVAAGAFLGWRWRPLTSVRRLRRAGTHGGEG
jgi:hypothetical protein